MTEHFIKIIPLGGVLSVALYSYFKSKSDKKEQLLLDIQKKLDNIEKKNDTHEIEKDDSKLLMNLCLQNLVHTGDKEKAEKFYKLWNENFPDNKLD